MLFLSRLVKAKGIPDLIAGYERSGVSDQVRLIIAGQGPQEEQVREMAAASPLADRITVLTDVDDDEKPALMRGCTAFVLPTLPRPEFVETFGIALVENMLAGGGPVITTETGGVPEAVGDTAITVPVSDPEAIAQALRAVTAMTQQEWVAHSSKAVDYALQFDRAVVLDTMLGYLTHSLEGVAC
ncbi:glycosyltransferase [Branchiibius cervicis]|uniref:Glycosyltransferase n=1 Tax=Branchiibius cervicis TaxID=908252 RepID=A0ABW2ASB2_9MICO